MPILEGNAVGRPVITSNIYSMPEIAGDAAILVDPYNIEEIRNGIVRIINDKIYRDQLVQNGFINIKRYNAHLVANKYFKLYCEIAAGSL
jgi:glycosyltransferase involved in cell wall biosynthesis